MSPKSYAAELGRTELPGLWNLYRQNQQAQCEGFPRMSIINFHRLRNLFHKSITEYQAIFYKIAQLVIIFIIISSVYLFSTRNTIGYPFHQALIDWKFGFVRRGLFGEIWRHITPPPYVEEQYQFISDWVILVLMSLIFIQISICELKNKGANRFWYVVFMVSSPLTLKNFVFDLGRMDAYGLIIFIVGILLSMTNLPKLILVYTTVLIPVASLISENLIFLYGIPLMVVCYISLENTQIKKYYFVPIIAIALALFVNLLAPAPHATSQEYSQYITSKSLTPWGTEAPETHLYMHVSGEFFNTIKDINNGIFKTKNHYTMLFVIIFFMATVVVMVSQSLRGGSIPTMERLLLWSLPLDYLVLFALGTDWLRWAANLSLVILILLYVYAERWKLRLGPSPGNSWATLLIVAQCFIPIGMGLGFYPPQNINVNLRKVYSLTTPYGLMHGECQSLVTCEKRNNFLPPAPTKIQSSGLSSAK